MIASKVDTDLIIYLQKVERGKYRITESTVSIQPNNYFQPEGQDDLWEVWE